MRRAALLVAVLGLLVGCGGDSEQVRERDVVVGGPPTTPRDRDREPRSLSANPAEVRIPVVSVNSGSDVYRRLGVLAHVGQEEDRAGAAAGRRMVASGVRHAVCLNHEPGNVGPDTRCRSFVAAMRAAGARAESLAIDVR